MTGEELKDWRKMVKLSQRMAGVILGYSKRNIQMMEQDKLEIRDGIALGCAAYALGIFTYNGPQLKKQRDGRKGKDALD